MKKSFNEWMLYIGNIYYTDDDMMARAHQIIEEHEEI